MIRCLLVRVFTIAVILISNAFAGNYRIETETVAGGTDQEYYLQYDDGSANWLTWSGTYRGVWFNTDDFVPGLPGLDLDFTEYWMYHHNSYPWDTSDFYAEVWNGDYMGPLVLLDETQVTGLHYAPAFAFYSPEIWAESNFWGIQDTEMSTGGWPSLLGDGTPPAVDHSFYSDDFFVWEPWSDGTSTGDYLIRAGQGTALDRTTWAEIKPLF